MASMQLTEAVAEREKKVSALTHLMQRYFDFNVEKESHTCERHLEKEELIEETKSERETSEVVFAVLYLQDTLPLKQKSFMSTLNSTNVYAAEDANFDLDLDPHFAEARSIFYEVLKNKKEGEGKIKFLKRPKEVVQQYEYNADSGDSDPEHKLLENLGQEMGLPLSPFTQ